MSSSLKGNVVALFGGSGKIGRMVVERLQTLGAHPVVISRQPEDILKQTFGPAFVNDGYTRNADICSGEEVKACLTSIRDQFGKLDSVVNSTWPRNQNFGARFEDVTFDDFKENMVDHVGGAFNISQQAVLIFQEQGYGNLINFSSIYGIVAPRFSLYEGTEMTKEIEYSLAKSSIIMLTNYLASYLRGQNIRVNCISPGGILNNQNEKFLEKYNAQCSSKGMLDASDVVGGVIFLLSDESKYVQGHNLVIDDGFVI